MYVEPESEEEATDEEEEEEEEDEPPAKRTRRGSRSASTSSPAKKGKRGQMKSVTTPPKSPGRKRKPAEPKAKKERKKKAIADKKEKPRRAGVLIPNENIELLENDPTFGTRFVSFWLVEIKRSRSTMRYFPYTKSASVHLLLSDIHVFNRRKVLSCMQQF